MNDAYKKLINQLGKPVEPEVILQIIDCISFVVSFVVSFVTMWLYVRILGTCVSDCDVVSESQQ